MSWLKKSTHGLTKTRISYETDMTENQNYKTNFNRSSLYQIPTKCISRFMDTWEMHL